MIISLPSLMLMWSSTHLHVIAAHSLRHFSDLWACTSCWQNRKFIPTECSVYYHDALFLKKITVLGKIHAGKDNSYRSWFLKHGWLRKMQYQRVVSPRAAFSLRPNQRHFKSTPQSASEMLIISTHHLHSALVFFQSSLHRIYISRNWLSEAGVGRETLKKYNIFNHARIEQRLLLIWNSTARKTIHAIFSPFHLLAVPDNNNKR